MDDPDYQRALKAVEDAYEDREAVQCRRELHIREIHQRYNSTSFSTGGKQNLMTIYVIQICTRGKGMIQACYVDNASKFLAH